MTRETTPFGSEVSRELTGYSLHGFEASNLGDGWSFLASADGFKHHATWANPETRSLLTFCEGDLITIQAPDDFIFGLEQSVQMDFCINQ
jgi:hypothetical protein